jgi:hypothetical protein
LSLRSLFHAHAYIHLPPVTQGFICRSRVRVSRR